MRWYQWFGIGALIGVLYGYRRKATSVIRSAVPPIVEYIARNMEPEDVMSIYAAVHDKDARHDTAVKLLVDAARRSNLNAYLTPKIAEQFIDSIDELIRQARE